MSRSHLAGFCVVNWLTVSLCVPLWCLELSRCHTPQRSSGKDQTPKINVRRGFPGSDRPETRRDPEQSIFINSAVLREKCPTSVNKMRCAVVGCQNYEGKKIVGLSFHSFPRNASRAKAWLQASGDHFSDIDDTVQYLTKSKEGKKIKICSHHFTKDCFYTLENRRYLHKTAKPSIFKKSDQSIVVLDIHKPKTSLPESSPSSTSSIVFLGYTGVAIPAPIPVATSVSVEDHDYTFDFKYQIHLKKNFLSSGSQATVTTKDKSVATFKSFSRRTVSTQTGNPRYKDASTSTRDLFHNTDGWCWPGALGGTVAVPRPDVGSQPSTSVLQTPRVVEARVPPSIPDGSVVMAPPQTNCPTEILPIYNLSIINASDILGSSFVVQGFIPDPEEETTEIGELSFVTDPSAEDYVSEKKFIVFESCLDELLQSLNKCNYQVPCYAPITDREKNISGSLLTVYTRCENNHRCLAWRSQPMAGSRSVGNILSSAAILFSGSHYSKVNEYFKILGVPFVSEAVHYTYQKNFVFPVIEQHHENDRKSVINSVKDQALCITGDGQCNSPGLSGKYCTYTFIDSDSKKILDSCVLQVNKATSSVATEKKAFVRSMDKLLAQGLQIEIVATDSHVGIRKAMKEKYSMINHQFDLWHYCKCLTNNLTTISKPHSLRELARWTTPVVNHMWSCSSLCTGDVEVLRESWRSLLHHVINEHKWESDGELKNCDHALTPEDEESPRRWLTKDTQPYVELARFITDERLDKDLPHLTYCCHTGDLEIYRNMLLKYRPNRLDLSMDGMIARTKLAVLAYNATVGRKQATGIKARTGLRESGPFFSKRKKTWQPNKIHNLMVIDHLLPMMADVVRRASPGTDSSWAPMRTSYATKYVLHPRN